MIKIVINGPESTGKTALAKKLAQHYHTIWEPELARNYVENLQGTYTFQDVCEIANLQIEQEKKYEKVSSNKMVFFDTDLIITKVWLEYKYNVVPAFLSSRLAEKFIDFYLLCQPDLPWEYDPVREHGDDREFFFDWYEREILIQGVPYAIIGGVGEERMLNARNAINDFLGKS